MRRLESLEVKAIIACSKRPDSRVWQPDDGGLKLYTVKTGAFTVACVGREKGGGSDWTFAVNSPHCRLNFHRAVYFQFTV